jgi:hypothetical protein
MKLINIHLRVKVKLFSKKINKIISVFLDRKYQNYRVPRSKFYYAIPIIIVTLAALSKVLFPTIFQ